MKRKGICFFLMLLVLGVFFVCPAVCADEAADAEGYREYKALGYNVKDPAGWEGLKGTLVIYPASSGSIMNDPELYASMLFYFPEDPEKVDMMDETYTDIMTNFAYLFTIKGDREALVDALKMIGMGSLYHEDTPETNLVQVGEADGYQFFVLFCPDDGYASSLDAEYQEDYSSLSAVITDELKQAEYYAPVDPINALTGKKISFTTTDLDGNTVTSGELFGDNEITMVNLWGIWCHNCVDEMEELAAIHTRLKEKGCGIVGLEWEENPDDYEKAGDLLAEKGTNYPCALMPMDNEILSTVTSFPTTFFVDREGTILGKPVVGAQVELYEPTLEALLGVLSGPEAAAAEGSYTYRVYVTDEEGNPVEEAAVQFCDDASCWFGETDEDGCAEFEVSEEKSYEVHIPDAPDGYDFDDEEVYSTDEKASDLTIVLKKA